jgi:hypothetical protein
VRAGKGLLAVALAVTAAYANSLDGELVLDARPLVLENPALRAVTFANLRTIATSPYWHPLANDGLYRPVTTFSQRGLTAAAKSAPPPP